MNRVEKIFFCFICFNCSPSLVCGGYPRVSGGRGCDYKCL